MRPAFVLVFSLPLVLTGCSSGPTTSPQSNAGLARSGVVQGGQQPVVGSNIQLYAVGTAGDASAATKLLTSAVQSDQYGNFNITSDYTCPSASTEVYLVATGGNPGLAAGTNNTAIAMMAALGPCGSLSPSTFIFVDEVTTIGSLAALYPYITSTNHLGSGSGDSAQLASAFTLVSAYTNIATGTAYSPEINTLGNIVASCINSSGGTAGDGSACGTLFALATPPSGQAPTDTIGALLDILNNPTQNAAAIFGLSGGIAPFQPSLSAAPFNWILTIPPVPSTSLTAAAGNAQVLLSWTASSGATSYNVLRSTSNGGPYSSTTSGVSTTQYTDMSVTNGTTYYYIVQALNGGGTSGNSNQASATPSGELQARVTANQMSFFVYEDQDSGFNHGFPSGFFASIGNLGTIHLDSGCIDDQADATTGCYPSTNTTALDTVHGTVMRISFDAQTLGNFAGLNIEEPQNWGVLQIGSGYDFRGASGVSFDIRSPNGAQVQFGVGGCTVPYTAPLPSTWTTMTISFSSLGCTPDLSNVHILFAVATNDQHSPSGATVLLDNIQITPLPGRTTQTQEGETLSLPLSTQTFGEVPQTSAPIPPDQANRNVAAIYEAALTTLALLDQGDAADAQVVMDAIEYALYHDNEGDYLSITPGGGSGCFSGNPATQCGLHSAYESGDIAILNDQNGGSGAAKAGDSRLAGFTCGSTSPTGYCLVLDGGTGGNNAWAIMALLAEYKQSGTTKYLNDAIAIGNWIIANLTDTTSTGYGGYYVGYPDAGVPPPKPLNQGKSTENNADIFAAFSALAKFDASHASAWTAAANAAGDFVMKMFDSTNGRFNTGTVPLGTGPGIGTCPTGAQQGNDVINTNSSQDCDFLDSDTFTTLAMAAAPRYTNYLLPNGKIMDWSRPVQYVLNTFAQTITVGTQAFQGFNIVSTPVSGSNGVAWEFTGQAVETMRYVDQLYNQTSFESQANFYLGQIQLARTSAPFGDNQGIVASTLQNGNTLAPLNQCLNTPYQNCPPERVGLAATNWLLFAEAEINPLTSP